MKKRGSGSSEDCELQTKSTYKGKFQNDNSFGFGEQLLLIVEYFASDPCLYRAR